MNVNTVMSTVLKCIIVSDAAMDQTSLFSRCSVNSGLPVEDNDDDDMTNNITIDKQICQLHLLDLSGQEEKGLKRQIRLAFQDTDVIIIAFSVVNHKSFENVKTKWHPLVKDHCQNIVILGTERDLKEGGKGSEVDYMKGLDMAEGIGAVKYVECSAVITEEDWKEVLFELEPALVEIKRRHEGKKCGIL